MATYTVAAGTDWIEPFRFGSVADRWRLDDYDIWMHVKRSGDDAALIEASLDDGRIIITDPLTRRLEVNIAWTEIEDIEPGPFEFDFLLQNRTTEVRSRSGPHTLTITRGITIIPEA